MEKIIVLTVIFISIVLLIQKLQKIVKGDEGCHHQNNCKK